MGSNPTPSARTSVISISYVDNLLRTYKRLYKAQSIVLAIDASLGLLLLAAILCHSG